ncbi:hypothetical protein CGCS363_v006099 [Colletotrichum siamense]|uniref:uncharacterized protein n=1 Tax=Colletotrichum siamense TaxID=690259 RepID=UPI001873385F|nr:uncharacterized protein CGCS363_v006099 [Colletotrichum siamense]KAF5501425.1 hypothetical protein CGCS363_v006099 [Colletotrichum siamense]
MAIPTHEMAHGASPVATRESYIGYKKDTQDLVEWMIKTTSLILKTQERSGENSQLPTGVSSSGATTVAGLVSMARLIADSGAAVSGSTFRRLISIVRARRSHYHAFVEHASTWSDTDIEKSNDMHRHFIDSLIDIFSILGGASWWEKQMQANEMSSKRLDSDAEQIEEMKGIIFSNKFASLDLSHGDSKPEPPSEPESDADEPVAESKAAKKKRVNGKKGKGKTSKPGKSRKPARKADSSADASVESYRILEDDQLLSYTMAILSFRTEWAQIRQYVQDLWIDVIHKNLNTAVAGAVSNVAIAKIKKTELELFDDFPEHCYFEKITDTLTRGGLHRLQKVAEDKAAADRDHHGCLVDVKEQLLMYTYQDLLDFCTDFQKSRNGKPTKAMRAKIGLWDPKLSLETATKEERILWRRKFTINWLYDLVNEYSSWEQSQRGERCFSDDVDWSPSGPSGSRRTLLGLTDFAAFVTSLVSQKTGSDLSLKISPWHVFQLQCIVDATSVKSGWSLCQHGGHILEAPAAGFLALRDINDIIDERPEDDAGHAHGDCCCSRSHLRFCKRLAKKLQRRQEIGIYNCGAIIEPATEVLSWSVEYLESRLGRCNSVLEGAPIPPSRFGVPHSLWILSPFLCGVGLAEALQIIYNTGMRFLDIYPVPTMMLHLEQMIHNTGGYEGKEHDWGLPLATIMRGLFRHCLYVEGKWPSKDAAAEEYVDALDTWAGGDITTTRRLRAKRVMEPVAGAVACPFPVRQNVNFNKMSHLMIYQEADWDPSRIHYTSLEPKTALAAVRLSREPTSFDLFTGEQSEPTELVQHMYEKVGWDDDWSGHQMSVGEGLFRTFLTMGLLKPAKANVEQSAVEKDLSRAVYSKLETILEDLEIAKLDLWNDISGLRCRSSMDFASLVLSLTIIMDDVENALHGAKNPTFERIYLPPGKGPTPPYTGKVFRLIREAMTGRDKSILEVFADKFEGMWETTPAYLLWSEDACLQAPIPLTFDKLGLQMPEQLRGDVCSVM